MSTRPWHRRDILPTAFERQLSSKGYGEYLFYQDKYLPGLPRRLNPDFPLNQIDGEKVLLVEPTFATQMNGEEAQALSIVLGLFNCQVNSVISYEPLDDDFTRVAKQKGLAHIMVERDVFEKLRQNHLQEIKINIIKQEILSNEAIFSFIMDAEARDIILTGKNPIDLILDLFQDQVLAYEQNYPSFDD